MNSDISTDNGKVMRDVFIYLFYLPNIKYIHVVIYNTIYLDITIKALSQFIND